MGVEGFVFGGQEGVDHPLRNDLDRDENPVLDGIFLNQPPIAGMDPRDYGRIIACQLVIIRQALGEMLIDEPAGNCTANGKHHDEAEDERQETRKTHDG